MATEQNVEMDQSISLDSLLKLVMIDIRRKVKISIRLVDNEGDEISIPETIEQISQYIHDKLSSEEDNTTASQIYPLMAQSAAYGLSRRLGPQISMLLLSEEMTRYSLIHIMAVGFYLWNVIHKNGFKIESTEEPVTQEEIDSYSRLDRATNVVSAAAAMGANPREIIKELLKKKYITREDLQKMGQDDLLEEEVEIDSGTTN